MIGFTGGMAKRKGDFKKTGVDYGVGDGVGEEAEFDALMVNVLPSFFSRTMSPLEKSWSL